MRPAYRGTTSYDLPGGVNWSAKLCCAWIDRLLGFTTLHDSRRYAIPRCLDPSHPDTKVRLTGDDEYAPINLVARPGRRCWTAT